MHSFLATAARSLSILLVAASFSFGQGQIPRHRENSIPRGDRGSREPAAMRNVSIDHELMITDLRVIEDPLRTGTNRRRPGVWSFKYLIEQMAGE
ncbi:MAG: hypothetical protein GY880_21815, partial [Planctomycetaceae bacterium]|nr:hypothetical protein [Planctomycetaceae bacterium]